MSVRAGFRFVALLALAWSAAGLAWSTATYSSHATSKFALTPFEPVTTIITPALVAPVITVGNATAGVVSSISFPGFAVPSVIDSTVFGSAAFAPDSLSIAEAQRGRIFVVPRVTPAGPLDTVTMRFSFEISWDTDLAITRPGLEFAAGGAFFGISGFEAGIDSITLDAGMPGEIVTFLDGSTGWQFNPSYVEFDGSPVDESHLMVVTGTIIVLSGMVGEFSVITDVAGRAVSVPLAPSWLLVLPALLLVRAARRR